MTDPVFAATLASQFASATVSRHFTDAALIHAMGRFEAALALAQAEVGLVPAEAAHRIAQTCAALARPAAEADDAFAPQRLAAAARRAGTLAIPFVQALTERVARDDPQAARWVHYGATSQDVLDTAVVLAASAAGEALLAQLAPAGDALAAIADAHRNTAMTGRTLLQQATPVSFGWKAACWLSPLARGRGALAAALVQARVVQLGGASGVRGAFGGRGDAIASALAVRLGLADPGISWHGTRDRIARLGAELALLAGAMARIGRDLALLMQPEVAEAFEPAGEGRGGSSAMPHKRNPVSAMLAVQAGLRAPGLAATLLASQAGEHERGLGNWQSDWWTLGALFECAGSATEAIGEAAAGLQVAPQAMAENLQRAGGFVHAEAVTMALAQAMGRPAAKALMERLCADALGRGCPLPQAIDEAVRQDARLAAALPEAERRRLFDAQTQLGDAGSMIDRALRDWRDPIAVHSSATPPAPPLRMMPTLPRIDARDWSSQPPWLHPAYRSTALRSPSRALLPIAHSLSELTQPVYGHDDIGELDHDLTRNAVSNGAPLGERIVVTGRVTDERGRPVRHTLVELWQCNAAGRYVHRADQHDAPLDPNFLGAGRTLTDAEGRYRFLTLKPGAYPWGNHPNAWRPAHIHLSLFGEHFASRLVTQMYFPGDPLLALDPIYQSTREGARERLVSRFDIGVTEQGYALGYVFDIVLRGPLETPMETPR